VSRSAKWLLTLVVLLWPLILKSQEEIRFRLLKTIHVRSDIFSTDPLGNLYYTNENGLFLLDASTQTRKEYSNQTYGPVHLVDAEDPLNILVFHPHFNRILWLDRNLTPKALPETPRFPDEFPKIICGSLLGGYWAFMPQQARLQRFNQAFRLQAQSLPFFELLPGFGQPSFLVESEGRIFASNPNQGIAVFDSFGNFISLIPRKGILQFQVHNDRIIYFTNTEIVIFDFANNQEILFLLPETYIRSGQLRGRRIFVQTQNEIKIYEASGNLF
jgi:hypothetical protein